MTADTAEIIKERVSMSEALSVYGYEINRAGYIICPFHSEKTASCKIYEYRFHCFGCGAGGDVIDFVKKLFDINFNQAIVRMNEDFHLGLSLDNQSTPEQRKMARERIAQRKRNEEEKRKKDKEYIKKSIEYRDCLFALNDLKPPTEFDFLHPDFVYALNNVERLRYELDCEL